MIERYCLELLLIGLLLASCGESPTGKIYKNQITVEMKGYFAKECIEKECVCFKHHNLNSQSTIPCSFYNKIEEQNKN